MAMRGKTALMICLNTNRPMGVSVKKVRKEWERKEQHQECLRQRKNTMLCQVGIRLGLRVIKNMTGQTAKVCQKLLVLIFSPNKYQDAVAVLELFAIGIPRVLKVEVQEAGRKVKEGKRNEVVRAKIFIKLEFEKFKSISEQLHNAASPRP